MASTTTTTSINVFKAPHNRMKELVEEHIKKVGKIEDFSQTQKEALDELLQVSYLLTYTYDV